MEFLNFLHFLELSLAPCDLLVTEMKTILHLFQSQWEMKKNVCFCDSIEAQKSLHFIVGRNHKTQVSRQSALSLGSVVGTGVTRVRYVTHTPTLSVQLSQQLPTHMPLGVFFGGVWDRAV